MRQSRFTEEQIIAILAEQERGMATAEVCRTHGISEGTFYKWKAKFGGMQVSDAKKLKALETENARLKRLLADAMLEDGRLHGRPGVGATTPRGARLVWLRARCGDSHFDKVRRIGHVGAYAGTRRRVLRIDPGIPHRVHRGQVGHSLQPHLGEQHAGSVTARRGEVVVEHRQDLAGLSGDVLVEIRCKAAGRHPVAARHSQANGGASGATDEAVALYRHRLTPSRSP